MIEKYNTKMAALFDKMEEKSQIFRTCAFRSFLKHDKYAKEFMDIVSRDKKLSFDDIEQLFQTSLRMRNQVRFITMGKGMIRHALITGKDVILTTFAKNETSVFRKVLNFIKPENITVTVTDEEYITLLQKDEFNKQKDAKPKNIYLTIGQNILMELLSINVDEIIEILTKNGAEMKEHIIEAPTVETISEIPQETAIEIDKPSLVDMQFLNPLNITEKIGDLIDKKQSTFFSSIKAVSEMADANIKQILNKDNSIEISQNFEDNIADIDKSPKSSKKRSYSMANSKSNSLENSKNSEHYYSSNFIIDEPEIMALLPSEPVKFTAEEPEPLFNTIENETKPQSVNIQDIFGDISDLDDTDDENMNENDENSCGSDEFDNFEPKIVELPKTDPVIVIEKVENEEPVAKKTKKSISAILNEIKQKKVPIVNEMPNEQNVSPNILFE